MCPVRCQKCGRHQCPAAGSTSTDQCDWGKTAVFGAAPYPLDSTFIPYFQPVPAIQAFGKQVACQPFPDTQVVKQEMAGGGMIAPKQKQELAALKVIHGNAAILAGSTIYVPAHLYTRYKQVYRLDGQDFILMREEDIVLVRVGP